MSIFDQKESDHVIDPALDGERRGIDRHRPSDAVYQQMQEEPQNYQLAEDGLPVPIIRTGALPVAPPLHPSLLVCMEIRDEFVLRDNWGAIIAKFPPVSVERTPSGHWRVSLRTAMENPEMRQRFRPLLDEQSVYFGESIRRAITEGKLGSVLVDDQWLEVEPLRRACQHYARQLTDFPDNPEAKFMERLCTARRDQSGEFLSMRDQVCFACEMRYPPDTAAVETHLTAWDDEKVREGEKRLAEATREPFDPMKELMQTLRAEQVFGILRSDDGTELVISGERDSEGNVIWEASLPPGREYTIHIYDTRELAEKNLKQDSLDLSVHPAPTDARDPDPE